MTINFNETLLDESLKTELPIFIDFYAEWCGPCKIIKPIIDELSIEYDHKVIIGKLNVDDYPDLAAKYDVQSLPTMCIIKNGEVVNKLIGAAPKPKIQEFINSNM